MLSENERKQLISKLNMSYCIPELWKNKESFLSLTDEQYKASLYDLSAAILLRIVMGDMAAVPHLMNLLPDVKCPFPLSGRTRSLDRYRSHHPQR